MSNTVWSTEIEHLGPARRGKVRDIYDLGDKLLIVACDRISAYDHVLQPGIPGKGKILSQLSNFWFERFEDLIPNHLVATDPRDFPSEFGLAPYTEILDGRSALVRKTTVVPFECVARGYLAGSGFKEYTANGTVCGISLPSGLERASKLPNPIFTPATKAESGHDENVTYDYMSKRVGDQKAAQLRDLTIEIYTRGSSHALSRGMILADTKFEFGELEDGTILLIDEVLTPDSSRFWDEATWQPGTEPISYDKQFVRNWLDEADWDHNSPPPRLPEEVVAGTLERYFAAFRKVTGEDPVL